jgi:hypothetical protein
MGFATPEEVRAGFVSSFPPGAGALAHEIGQSLVRLHLKWKNYRCLYGTSRERIDILNAAAPSFFVLLHGVLWNDVLLAICRLVDPPRSAGRNNASLGRLIESLESVTEEECVRGKTNSRHSKSIANPSGNAAIVRSPMKI